MPFSRHLSIVLTTFLSILFTMNSVAISEDKVENPIYTAWSSFKLQTSVKYKNTNKIKVMGMEITSESDLTMKLVELTNDKVVIETGTLSKINGQEYQSPLTKQEYPRMIALKPGQKKADVAKPDGVFEEGKEKIKVAAGEYETTWNKSKVEDRVLQTWISATVPGTLVKTVTTIGGETPGTNVLELVQVTKP